VHGVDGSRLVKERDEARQQLADASAAGKLYTGAGPAAAGPAQAGGDSMDVDAGGAADDVGITDKVLE
jgi:hypothetical protein